MVLKKRVDWKRFFLQQVFDPSGRFLRAFGSQGTADGRFNYPWGITTDALGFIYVCDKENHRVQVSLNIRTHKNYSLMFFFSFIGFPIRWNICRQIRFYGQQTGST